MGGTDALLGLSRVDVVGGPAGQCRAGGGHTGPDHRARHTVGVTAAEGVDNWGAEPSSEWQEHCCGMDGVSEPAAGQQIAGPT